MFKLTLAIINIVLILRAHLVFVSWSEDILFILCQLPADWLGPVCHASLTSLMRPGQPSGVGRPLRQKLHKLVICFDIGFKVEYLLSFCYYFVSDVVIGVILCWNWFEWMHAELCVEIYANQIPSWHGAWSGACSVNNHNLLSWCHGRVKYHWPIYTADNKILEEIQLEMLFVTGRGNVRKWWTDIDWYKTMVETHISHLILIWSDNTRNIVGPLVCPNDEMTWMT